MDSCVSCTAVRQYLNITNWPHKHGGKAHSEWCSCCGWNSADIKINAILYKLNNVNKILKPAINHFKWNKWVCASQHYNIQYLLWNVKYCIYLLKITFIFYKWLVFWNINFNWVLNYGKLNVKIEEMCINNYISNIKWYWKIKKL